MRLAALCLLAACTGTTVTITTDASYVRYRAGGAAWHVPHPLPDGRYSFTADDELEVVAVLDQQPDFFATELYATVDDGDRWTLQFSTLDGASPTPPVTAGPESLPAYCAPTNIYPGYAVTGQMQQLGTVTIGGRCASPPFMPTTPWSFTLDVELGTYDVIAASSDATTAPRVAITRGLTIDGPTTLPPIDLDQQGTPSDARTVTIGNAGPDTTLDYGVYLYTTGAAATIASRGAVPITNNTATLYVAPNSILAAGDTQTLSMSVVDSGVSRHAYSTAPATDAVYDLLPAPPVTYSADGSATWTDPLSSRAQLVDLDIAAAAIGSGSDHVTATGRWLAAHHASSLAFDTSPPDFDPSWIVDPAASRHTFVVRATEGSISYLTYETH